MDLTYEQELVYIRLKDKFKDRLPNERIKEIVFDLIAHGADIKEMEQKDELVQAVEEKEAEFLKEKEEVVINSAVGINQEELLAEELEQVEMLGNEISLEPAVVELVEEAKDYDIERPDGLTLSNSILFGSVSGSLASDHFESFLAENNNSRVAMIADVQVNPLMYPEKGMVDVEKYLASITELEDKHKDIQFYKGISTEYNKSSLEYLQDLRRKVDVMILDQKHITVKKEKDNPNIPLAYADMIVFGIETGLYDVVSNPDYFMTKLEQVQDPSSKKEFLDNAKVASERICEATKKYNVPLELDFGVKNNVSGVEKDKMVWTSPLFVQAAISSGAKVLSDDKLKNPDFIKEVNEYYKSNSEPKVNIEELTFASDNYDPIIARDNNPLLPDIKDIKQDTVSVEAAFIQNVLERGVNQDGDMLVFDAIDETLDNALEVSSNQAQTIYDSYDKLEITGEEEALIIATYDKRTEVIESAKEAVQVASEVGCETVEDYKEIVPKLVDLKYANPSRVEQLSEEIEEWSEEKQNGTNSLNSIGAETEPDVYDNETLGDDEGTLVYSSNSAKAQQYVQTPKVYQYTNNTTGGASYLVLTGIILVMSLISIMIGMNIGG